MNEYCICPYRSWAQIEAGARIEARGQGDNILIEAGSRIVAGFVGRCIQVASIDAFVLLGNCVSRISHFTVAKEHQVV